MRGLYTLCLIIGLAGCGSSEPYTLAEVSGTITMDGEPLPNVSVTFQPIAEEGKANVGPGSYGRTDEEGRFTLMTVTDDTSGAVVGSHSVSVTTPADNESGDSDVGNVIDPIPARYNAATELTQDVPAGGTESLKIELTSEMNGRDPGQSSDSN